MASMPGIHNRTFEIDRWCVALIVDQRMNCPLNNRDCRLHAFTQNAPAKWNVGNAMGKGVDACYAAVMADEECTYDYFTNATRGDKNCGCKKSGAFSPTN